VFDPVSTGLVASLARPGGNITGFTNFEPTMASKWWQLLKETAPRVKRVALLFNPATRSVLNCTGTDRQIAKGHSEA
jgi:putative tryptophan/tyrosine transport system substrate-binding protein